MFTIKAVATFALTAITLVACSAGPEGNEAQEATGTTESAMSAKGSGSLGQTCATDSSCNRGLVCDPICPISPLPGTFHCETIGNSCQPTCQRTPSELAGTSFSSVDGVHKITFTSKTEFSQTDGCPLTGIHCQNIKLTVGTYTSNGTTISLKSSLGARNTMSVESHCYEGLVDNSDGVELYLAPAAAN